MNLYDEKNIFIAKLEQNELKEHFWKASEEDDTIEKKLTSLYRKTKENFQELGINSCFISIYSLKYKENQKSENYFLAPLLLFPINIERLKYTSKEKHRFELISDSDDLHINPALIEKLRNDFKIEIPEFIGQLDTFLRQVKNIISGREEWEIINDCYLDIFSYQKYIMYSDLDNHQDIILENDLIKAFVGDQSALQNAIADSLRNEWKDDINGIDVLSADSSQKNAIELAKAGLSFVLQGPPGTGKSQTISNIISALMEQKKKLLFVSQKMAALNVVQKRLDEVSLSRYCLNLHNYKGNKKEIIKQLMNELETSPIINESQKNYSFKSYITNQNKINTYYKYLCEEHEPRNLSIYRIRGELSKLLDVDFISNELNLTIKLNEENFSEQLDIIDKIDQIRTKITNPLNSIYFKLKKDKTTTIHRENLKNTIKDLQESLLSIIELSSEINEHTNITIVNIDSLHELSKKHHEFNSIANIPKYLCSENFSNYQILISNLFDFRSNIDELSKKLKEQVNDNFFDIDTNKYHKIFISTNFLSRLFSKKYHTAKLELQQVAKKNLKYKDWMNIFKDINQLQLNKKKYDEELKINSQYITNIGDISNILNLSQLKEIVNTLTPFYNWVKIFAKNNAFMLIKYFFNNTNSLKKVENFIHLTENIQDFFEENFFDKKEKLSVIKNRIDQVLKQKDKIDNIINFKENFSNLPKEIQDFVYAYFEINSQNTLKKIFLKSYYMQLLDKILATNFISVPKMEIEKFKSLDMEVRDVQRFKIMNTIENEQPSHNYKSNGLNEVSEDPPFFL